MACGRLLDLIFAVYFLVSIPVALFIDGQLFLPETWIPKQAYAVSEWYTQEYRDALYITRPPWYKSMLAIEVFVQVPFFVVAFFAFLKGGCRWIRIPTIIYSSQLITMLVPIFCEIAVGDFPEDVGPRNRDERIKLASAYAAFALVAVLLLLRVTCGRDYRVRRADKRKAE